jgi:2,5-diketo-D-gluconate reductase B
MDLKSGWSSADDEALALNVADASGWKGGPSGRNGGGFVRYITAKGATVPVLGFGTWEVFGPEGRRTIEDALSLGYRSIDTAQMYGNEDQVGAAIRASRVDRSELFVVTKIDNANHGHDATRRSAEDSLRRLGLEYIDLLLIHWPSRTEPLSGTLAAMAALKREGKVRSLGVSNFTTTLLAEAVESCGADLLCNQVEYHPFLPQRRLRAALARYGMMLTAYSPLAKGQATRNPTLSAIGKRYGKTASQVALCWLIGQEGVAAIPKASNRAHMIDNLAALDFALTPEDCAAIDRLGDPQGRVNDVPGWSPVWDKD